MKPVYLEVIAPVLTAYSHCPHCEMIFDRIDVATKKHQMDIEEYPEEFQKEYARLCDWVKEISQRYRERILIKIIDPQSLEGLYKSIRYRVRKYPTFVINSREKYVGWEKGPLDAALERLIARRLNRADAKIKP